jgi:hypothetical protein
MNSERDRPHVGGRLEDSKAVTASGVHDELPRTHRTGSHEFLNHTRQVGIRDGDQDEISIGSDR